MIGTLYLGEESNFSVRAQWQGGYFNYCAARRILTKASQEQHKALPFCVLFKVKLADSRAACDLKSQYLCEKDYYVTIYQ